jgi:ATP-dependent DNA helicase PIF1
MMEFMKSQRSVDPESIIIPPGFVLDEDLAAAFHLLEFTSETFFLTGRAGTGKSSLLNYFRKHTIKKYVVLAPTGLAALQVGGATIHSFFGFPLRVMLPDDPEIVKWGKGHPRLRIVKKMDTLVIDEVSMLRADLLDAIDQSLRLNLGSDAPFGGKQVVFIGDVFQLAPVHSPTESELAGEEEYPNPYFFSARSFMQSRPRVVELKRIYRQNDEDFIYLLNRVRMGIASQEDLDTINERLETNGNDQPFAVTLTSVNAIADAVNQQRIIELKSPPFSYRASVDGKFHSKLFPTSERLSLKVGAQVMMVKNDLQGKWVNGSIGVVESLTPEKVQVKFSDGSVHPVDRAVWENKSYTWDRAERKITFDVLGSFTQFPMKLAWAITIHKSQGLTFDNINIDLGRGAFTHGQLYVALSRCRTLEGIRLRSKIQLKDMIVDEAVGDFAGKFRIR